MHAEGRVEIHWAATSICYGLRKTTVLELETDDLVFLSPRSCLRLRLSTLSCGVVLRPVERRLFVETKKVPLTRRAGILSAPLVLNGTKCEPHSRLSVP
jgi:hypothetical protein